MNVYEKISEVMKEIEYLTKDDFVETGKGRGYRAVTEEKVTTAVRKSLIKNGLVIVPVRQERNTTTENVVDKYGNQRVNHLVELDVVYRLQNIDDQEDYIEIVSSGAGVDTQDKAVGKAMTYAYKYMLLRAFGIPTGEDPDKISSDVYSMENTPANNTITAKDYKNLISLVQSKGHGEEWLLTVTNRQRPEQITREDYTQVVKALADD